jgi:predicted  nucleic acid-binding Zn-ribbon protein
VKHSNILIGKCLFCGKLNCEAHSKYTDRCVDCGKRYAKYSNYKSLQKSDFRFKRQAKLEEIIEEYQELKLRGYKVPRDLQ